MNQQFIDECKQKLLMEQKRLKNLLGHEGHKDKQQEFPGGYKPDYPEVGHEEGENASEVEQFEENLAVSHDLETNLKKVEAALKRIQEGTFGKCVEGDDIEEERLSVIPEAETCIKHSH
jgi:RNA polymerase-binding transcription factor DksA